MIETSERRHLRLVMSCGARGWGGLERQALLMADRYASMGHEVLVLAVPETPFAANAMRRGFEVRTLLSDSTPRLIPALASLTHLWRSLSQAVIHVHEGRDLRLIVPTLVLARRDFSLYVTRHMGVRHDRHDLWHRWIYARVRCLYAISNHVARETRKNLPLAEERIVVRPPGIEAVRFHVTEQRRRESRRRFGWDDTEFVVGMLGRVTPQKGHEDFLSAASRLIKTRPRLRFVLVGSAGREWHERRLEEELRLRAQALGPRVEWHPATEQPETYYAAFDAFVFPSHNEAFGLALIEAMASACPVIAAAAAGVLDIVTDGYDGLLFPPHDAQELERLIAWLDDHPEEGRRLGKRARETALTRWDIGKIAESYIEDFQKDMKYS